LAEVGLESRHPLHQTAPVHLELGLTGTTGSDAARLLREEWSFRRKNAPGISTPFIDHLIKTATRQGAEAAKVCGAGGGGCVFFLVSPESKARVAASIVKEGGTVLPASVALQGVKLNAKQAGA